jgi:hypothetical protein
VIGLSFEDHLRYEATTGYTVAFKVVHVDMAEDVLAGLLLSQLYYWHTPNRETGETRLTVEREGHLWLRKGYDEWEAECRLTKRQAERAVDILVGKGLIEKRVWHDERGRTKVHLRIVGEAYMAALDQHLPPLTSRSRHNGDRNPPQRRPESATTETGSAPDGFPNKEAETTGQRGKSSAPTEPADEPPTDQRPKKRTKEEAGQLANGFVKAYVNLLAERGKPRPAEDHIGSVARQAAEAFERGMSREQAWDGLKHFIRRGLHFSKLTSCMDGAAGKAFPDFAKQAESARLARDAERTREELALADLPPVGNPEALREWLARDPVEAGAA